jgi:hypothetical protein
MRSELIGIRLPLHNAAVIRRRAADIGLTKSAFAANLVLRGLELESADQLPALLGILDDKLERLESYLKECRNASRPEADDIAQLQNPAFIIEVLLLLRYPVREDLKVKGKIGQKIREAVGDVCVEAT